MISQLFVSIVVEAFHGRVPDGAVHAFDPVARQVFARKHREGAVAPWVFDPGPPARTPILAVGGHAGAKLRGAHIRRVTRPLATV